MNHSVQENNSTHAYPGLLWQSGMVLLFNTLIAITLSLLTSQGWSWTNLVPTLIYSHSIGFSIFTVINLLGLRHPRDENKKPLDVVIGIALGSVVGSLLGGLFNGTLDYMLTNGISGLGANIMLGILFGSAIGHYFFATYKMIGAKLELQQRENRHLSAEKELAETRLRLLQAQIEPHFLFNVLSNIHGLIETDPHRASSVLESLSDYLRASLRRSREGDTTLGDELALINAYMDIQQARMGERLRFKVAVPQALLPLRCPPMLVQPLVENAVVHGIEPRVENGQVELTATQSTGGLRIEVNDNGMGFTAATRGNGLAVENIRARLQALYGDAARLTIGEREPHGMQAVLELPVGEADGR